MMTNATDIKIQPRDSNFSTENPLDVDTISTNIINQTSSSSDSVELSAGTLAYLVYLIIVLIVGLICNTLAFIIMRRRRVRHLPTSIHLSYLALADNLALILFTGKKVFFLEFGIFRKMTWDCRIFK